MDVQVASVDECAQPDASKVGVGEGFLPEPGPFIGQFNPLVSVLPQVLHDHVDADGHADGCDEAGCLHNLIVDPLAVDAGDEEAVGCQSDCANDGHPLGVFGVGEAVDPPLDEEQLQEVDEEGVHHADPEDYSVGVLEGRLQDSRIRDLGGCPLR